jgi:hypothetical protein
MLLNNRLLSMHRKLQVVVVEVVVDDLAQRCKPYLMSITKIKKTIIKLQNKMLKILLNEKKQSIIQS